MVRMSEGHLQCVHTIRFSELTKNLQFGAKTITGISCKFVGACYLSRRVSDENRACSISIRVFKITDPCVGRSFSLCSHYPIFGTNKNRILKNGSCEAMRLFYGISAGCGKVSLYPGDFGGNAHSGTR